MLEVHGYVFWLRLPLNSKIFDAACGATVTYMLAEQLAVITKSKVIVFLRFNVLNNDLALAQVY